MSNQTDILSIADNIPVLYDLWLLGDTFLREIFGSYQAMRLQARSQRNREDEFLPYIKENFNVNEFYQSSATSGVKVTMARIINNLQEAVRIRKRIPKYLIVIPDKDILHDVDVTDPDAPEIVNEIVQYFVNQISLLIKRKKIAFIDKKPGSLRGYSPTIIFVRMLRRVGSFSDQSKIYSLLKLRAKFNDALNDAVAKTEHRILTIRSCNSYDHFDRHGNLSSKGKNYFWMELDELIERYESNKVKLFPNPKNPPNSKNDDDKSRRR